MDIDNTLQAQRDFFHTGKTKDLDFRIEQLKLLKQALKENKDNIIEAAQQDMRKPVFEAYVSEYHSIIEELDFTIKKLKSWAAPESLPGSLFTFPAKNFLYKEPLGLILIISPWNYPFSLSFVPLIGAIAAGNCAVIKTSEFTPHASALMKKIIEETFESNYISLFEGDAEVGAELLMKQYDHIFFTGSTQIGKIVMKAASQHLTTVTLELGGKSPCIVNEESDLADAAKKIAWGKFFNAGQTCVAPDYILVHKSVKEEFLENLKQSMNKFFGFNPQLSKDYARIINNRHFQRLKTLVELYKPRIVAGGQLDANDLYVAPTLIDDVAYGKRDPENSFSEEEIIMQEEIFGPLLPISEYEDLDDIISYINSKPKPLALYLFSNNKEVQDKVLEAVSAGGVCINDTLAQASSKHMPFGGVGASGMGRYHGKYSFDTFSHAKPVVKKSFPFDLPFKFAPYNGLLEKLLHKTKKTAKNNP